MPSAAHHILTILLMCSFFSNKGCTRLELSLLFLLLRPVKKYKASIPCPVDSYCTEGPVRAASTRPHFLCSVLLEVNAPNKTCVHCAPHLCLCTVSQGPLDLKSALQMQHALQTQVTQYRFHTLLKQN